MSDTVKLIIEIPELAYKACQKLRTNNDDGIVGLCAVNSIANGTLLDDVKAKIEESRHITQDPFTAAGLETALEILDNVGKGVSE